MTLIHRPDLLRGGPTDRLAGSLKEQIWMERLEDVLSVLRLVLTRKHAIARHYFGFGFMTFD